MFVVRRSTAEAKGCDLGCQTRSAVDSVEPRGHAGLVPLYSQCRLWDFRRADRRNLCLSRNERRVRLVASCPWDELCTTFNRRACQAGSPNPPPNTSLGPTWILIACALSLSASSVIL